MQIDTRYTPLRNAFSRFYVPATGMHYPWVYSTPFETLHILLTGTRPQVPDDITGATKYERAVLYAECTRIDFTAAV